MNRRTENFFALCAMLDNSRKPRSPAHAAAKGFVEHEIFATIRFAFETYPELSVEEVLEVCRPHLVDALSRILER
jgi:hypothetical protein